MFTIGTQVRLVKQGEPHTVGRPIRIGTAGKVIARRPNDDHYLVKFVGYAIPRDCDRSEIER